MNEGTRPASSVALATQLIHALETQHALRERDARMVIAIAGESGSGKSVTAVTLASGLSALGLRADVLHQDDYFHRPPASNHAHRILDLHSVGPQEVNFNLLRAHVAAFRAGANALTVPRVDYPGNRFVAEQRDFAALAVLVVEGTYVLSSVHADIRIFLEATSDDSRERRSARNRDIDAPIVEQVLAIERPLIAAQGAAADIIIDRDFTIVRTSR